MSEESPGAGACCPRCDAPFDGEASTCPECGLEFLDEEGDLSQDAIDAMMDNADVSIPDGPSGGAIVTPAPIRLFVALAICVPLAPILVFVAVSIAPLGLWTTGAVFLLGWVVPAYALARARVPTRIVANGLLAIGLVLSSAPLVIVAGRTLLGTDTAEIGTLGTNVFAAQGLFLVFGLLVFVAGVFVRRHAIATEARWDREAEPPER